MLVALVLVLSPWGHPVAASDPSAAPEGVEPAAPPAGTDEDDDDAGRRDRPDEARRAEAGAAFTNGVEAYKQERYHDAALYFERAQRLAPHADTLYNLGLAQQRAENHVGAWHSFEELLATTTDPQEREDILAAQALSRARVALLRIATPSRGVVCLDGMPMPRHDDGYAQLTTAGPHRVDVDRERRQVELERGETRTMEIAGRPVVPPAPPRRRLRVLSAFSIAGAGAAAGLGLGAGLVEGPPPLRLGLGIGAAAAGTVALSSAVIALAVHRRARRFTPPPPLRRCP